MPNLVPLLGRILLVIHGKSERTLPKKKNNPFIGALLQVLGPWDMEMTIYLPDIASNHRLYINGRQIDGEILVVWPISYPHLLKALFMSLLLTRSFIGHMLKQLRASNNVTTVLAVSSN